MWCVICAPDDSAALWACEGLQRRGLVPLEVICSDALAVGTCWEHRLEDGRVWTNMTLPDGRQVRSQDVCGVLNRISFIPSGSLLLIHPSDRHYVTHELQAFFLSWLHALPGPVLNRPTPLGLSGQLRHASEWVWLASQAGLPNWGYRQTSHDPPLQWTAHLRLAPGIPVTTLVVAGGVVTGPPAPAYIQAGCRRLSQLSDTALLGVDFAVGPDDVWTFAGVSTCPDLRLGGAPLLDALAAALTGRPQEEP